MKLADYLRPVPAPATTSASSASASSKTSTTKKPILPAGQNHPKPFTRLQQGTWLHDRSESDTYKLLLDAFRMGQADADSFEGVPPQKGHKALESFKGFLRLAESRKGLLPAWWNAAHASSCVEYAMDRTRGNEHTLFALVNKADIIQRYNDDKLPMQLRMISEAITGRGVMGQSGKGMMDMQASQEKGDSGLVTSSMDMSGLLARLNEMEREWIGSQPRLSR